MKRLFAMLLTLALVLSMTACGSASNPGGQSDQSGDGSVDYSKQLVIGSSNAGGTYYTIGAGWTSLMNDKLGTNISCEVTAGPATNIPQVESGDLDFGMVTSWLEGEAFNGVGTFSSGAMTEGRALFSTHVSYLHMVTLEKSDINTVADLSGKAVALGTAGATSDVAGRAVMETLNITPKSISNLGGSDQLSALKDGTVDAIMIVGGTPSSNLLDLQTTNAFKYITFTDSDISALLTAYPFWATDVIAGGTYDCVPDDYTTIAFWNYIIADKDLSEEFVYDLVKTTFENLDYLMNVDVAAAGISTDNLNVMVTPLHPGAYKYYTEIGLEIPENIKPID